jgi:hypothetical protein
VRVEKRHILKLKKWRIKSNCLEYEMVHIFFIGYEVTVDFYIKICKKYKTTKIDLVLLFQTSNTNNIKC